MDVSFTDREADVMQILWDNGPSVVSEVRAHLHDQLAYTTVLTVLRTLLHVTSLGVFFVALRYLREGRMQTALILGAVSIGVAAHEAFTIGAQVIPGRAGEVILLQLVLDGR